MENNPILTDRQTLIDLMVQSVNITYQTIRDNEVKLFQLKSIYWKDHRRKYIVGDTVIVKNGQIINSQGQYTTHEITNLEGTLNDSKHVFTVKDLVTDEILKIEL